MKTARPRPAEARAGCTALLIPAVIVLLVILGGVLGAISLAIIAPLVAAVTGAAVILSLLRRKNL